jgi:hypothetical protein
MDNLRDMISIQARPLELVIYALHKTMHFKVEHMPVHRKASSYSLFSRPFDRFDLKTFLAFLISLLHFCMSVD